jgi:F0F1-type ATP synthase membrane subunit b/b'
MIRAARNLANLSARFGIFFFLIAAPALAQEQTEPKIEDSPTGQVFRWINFVLVVVIILYLGRKAPAYFRGHAEEISQKIAEGARAREAAEKHRSEAQAKLATIGNDIAQMREEAKRAAVLEAERVRALAKTEAEAIERAALAEIAATEHAARLELRVLAARMAVERAEGLLREALKPKMDAEQLVSFVAWLTTVVGQQARAGEVEGSTN